MKEIDEADKNLVPEKVRRSELGCRNCLWYSVECDSGSKYSPRIVLMDKKKISSCAAHTYYD